MINIPQGTLAPSCVVFVALGERAEATRRARQGWQGHSHTYSNFPEPRAHKYRAAFFRANRRTYPCHAMPSETRFRVPGREAYRHTVPRWSSGITPWQRSGTIRGFRGADAKTAYFARSHQNGIPPITACSMHTNPRGARHRVARQGSPTKTGFHQSLRDFGDLLQEEYRSFSPSQRLSKCAGIKSLTLSTRIC